MKYGMEEFYCGMKWNGKFLKMEWNGRFQRISNTENFYTILFHSMPWLECDNPLY